MLSKKSGKLFKIVIRWCNVCGSMPFIWNGRRGQVCITRKGQIRWGLAFLIQLGLCMYTYIQLLQIVASLGNLQQRTIRRYPYVTEKAGYCHGNSHEKEGRSWDSFAKIDVELVYCFIHALVHTFMIALNINTILKQRSVVLFTNSYLKFTSHFREAYIVRLRRTWKNGCEELVQIMITFAISAPLLPTIHFFFNPLHPMYLTYNVFSYRAGSIQHATQLMQGDIIGISSIVRQYGLPMTIFIIGTFGLAQILFIWVITSTILFLTVNVTISAYVFRSAIREMTIESIEGRPPQQRVNARHTQYIIPSYVTKDKLRTCSHLVRCYRSFQIVQTLAHNCFSGLAFVVEILEIFFISLIMFVLLQFSEIISIGSAVLLLLVVLINYLIWNFILSIVGRFKSRTLICCQSWKHLKCSYVNEIRYMKVVKKSCPPITIWAGNNTFEMEINHIPLFLYAITCSVIVWNAMYHDNYCPGN